ncbi:MAG: FHA domain-containing protein [Candidatus Ancillula sp.]|nr:FHA domain-containing protein [Candidatus Ancillula sp.]
MLSAIALVRKDIFGKSPALKLSTSTPSALAQELPAAANIPASVAVSSGGVLAENATHNVRTEDGYRSPRTKPTAIHVLSGIAVGDIITLDSFETLIGRLDTSNITLHDSFVSSKHARIFWQSESCYIEDLHSTNGTVVDGTQISKITELKVGSRITIGKNVLELI